MFRLRISSSWPKRTCKACFPTLHFCLLFKWQKHSSCAQENACGSFVHVICVHGIISPPPFHYSLFHAAPLYALAVKNMPSSFRGSFLYVQCTVDLNLIPVYSIFQFQTWLAPMHSYGTKLYYFDPKVGLRRVIRTWSASTPDPYDKPKSNSFSGHACISGA